MREESEGFVPMGTRLRPPRSDVATVQRVALLSRLAASEQRLVLVSAPAGYGKTTLVRQWVDAEAMRSVWLRLEVLHDDPVALLTYLAAGLAGVATLDPQLTRFLAMPHPPIEARVLPELAVSVEQAAPFILVLDDAHVLSSPACWRYLGLLLEALPAGGRLAVTSRADPPLPLARLRTQGDLLEVRMSDLRMDRDEALELLRLHGRGPSDAELDVLLESTEGWPAGLYLALLADVTEIHGDLHQIAAYLTSEVLDRQSDDLREFMLKTSVMSRLTAASCRALTGRDDAGVVLQGLARDNLFLVPIDDHDEAFRYHQLFGELLYAQLLRRSPSEANDLHRRAGAWFREQGDLDEAVRQAVAAGDADTATTTDLAAVACDRHMIKGHYGLAASLFDCFGDQTVKKWPALSLTAAQLGNYTRDLRVQRLGALAMSAAMSFDPSPVGASSLRGWQVVVRAARAPEGVECMLQDAELASAMEKRAADQSFLEMAEGMRAMSLYLLGRNHHSVEVIDAALARRGDEEMAVWWLGLRTMIAADQEDWRLAESLHAEAMALPPTQVMIPSVLAHVMILAHRSDPETIGYIERAEADVFQIFSCVEWRAILSRVVFGEAALRLGDLSQAERWAVLAEEALSRYPEAGMLRGRVRRLREAIESNRLAEPLTPAERRVLALLPTQLTADQMAARLFLTRNTVKSHLRHIYVKLGVTRRTDAVETAQRLGLL